MGVGGGGGAGRSSCHGSHKVSLKLQAAVYDILRRKVPEAVLGVCLSVSRGEMFGVKQFGEPNSRGPFRY